MRWLAAWALYLAGAALCWGFDSEWGPLHPSFYRVYNRLMTLSERVQGPSDHGPWARISS